MSFGVEIRNTANNIVLDNYPAPVLEVIETGTLASGFIVTNIIDTVNKTFTFIRPSVTTAYLYGDFYWGNSGDNWNQVSKVYASTGDISYIKLKECSAATPTGFGLTVYDSQATPILIFTDSIHYPRFIANINSNFGANVTITADPPFSGHHRYINANAFMGMERDISATYYPKFYTDAGESNVHLDIFTVEHYAPYARIINKQITIIDA